jgi:hypothetical protein
MTPSADTAAPAKQFRVWQFSLRTLLVFVLLNALGLAALIRSDVQRDARDFLITAYTWLLRPRPFGERYSSERLHAELLAGRMVVVHVCAAWDPLSESQRRWLDSPEMRYRLASRNVLLLRCDCTDAVDDGDMTLDASSIYPGKLAVFRPGGDVRTVVFANILTVAIGAKESSSDVGFIFFCVATLIVAELIALFGPRMLSRSPMPTAAANPITPTT